jgi:malate dehydrogenase (oxaloacetate-decarboxylating)(NADP+)
MVTDDHLAEGRLYPPLNTVREVSTKLAARIVSYAYKRGMAATYPEPKDKIAFVRAHQYSTNYESFIPKTYPWPGMQD